MSETKEYKVTIKVESNQLGEKGYIEREYVTEFGYEDFDERVNDMIDTLEKSKEIKF